MSIVFNESAPLSLFSNIHKRVSRLPHRSTHHQDLREWANEAENSQMKARATRPTTGFHGNIY
jgi:hypothetical protein